MKLFWIFLVLNFVNWVCDYPLQNFFLAEWKQKSNYALTIHCFIWSFGICIALQHFEMFAWWKFIMLFVGHLLMDGWKCRGYYKKIGLSDKASFNIDQTFHLIQIALCLI